MCIRDSHGTTGLMNFSRPEQLHELESKSEFDLLIIGGGIVGSAALEMAASSGLSSVLLEKNDFASGASGRSTKPCTVELDTFPNYNLA